MLQEKVFTKGCFWKENWQTSSRRNPINFCFNLLDDKNLNVCVCQKAFCTVYRFGPKRIQVMQRKIESGELKDVHGKHDNHPAVDSEIKDLVLDHIKSLPSRQSHYLRKDNSERTYLSPDLSITRLYHEFFGKA